jgi:hypothetical protein
MVFFIFLAVCGTVGWLLDNAHVTLALCLIGAYGIFYLVNKWICLKHGYDED